MRLAMFGLEEPDAVGDGPKVPNEGGAVLGAAASVDEEVGLEAVAGLEVEVDRSSPLLGPAAVGTGAGTTVPCPELECSVVELVIMEDVVRLLVAIITVLMDVGDTLLFRPVLVATTTLEPSVVLTVPATTAVVPAPVLFVLEWLLARVCIALDPPPSTTAGTV